MFIQLKKEFDEIQDDQQEEKKDDKCQVQHGKTPSSANAFLEAFFYIIWEEEGKHAGFRFLLDNFVTNSSPAGQAENSARQQRFASSPAVPGKKQKSHLPFCAGEIFLLRSFQGFPAYSVTTTDQPNLSSSCPYWIPVRVS